MLGKDSVDLVELKSRLAARGWLDQLCEGGPGLFAAALEAGVVDELRLHLSPLVLGAGTALFEGASRRLLTQREVLVSPLATHLTYDVGR